MFWLLFHVILSDDVLRPGDGHAKPSGENWLSSGTGGTYVGLGRLHRFCRQIFNSWVVAS